MENIKEWYKSNFPNDNTGNEINPNCTFKELKNNIRNVYSFLDVGESTIRERVFLELAKRTNVDYDVVYNNWLKGEGEYSKNDEFTLFELRLLSKLVRNERRQEKITIDTHKKMDKLIDKLNLKINDFKPEE